MARVEKALHRRSFLRLSAAAVSVAALPIAACGGDGNDEGRVDTDDTDDSGTDGIAWEMIPELVFAEGMASSISIAEYLNHPNGVALSITKNEVPLPPGVTFDPIALRFDYDGVGAAATTTGHVLSARVEA